MYKVAALFAFSAVKEGPSFSITLPAFSVSCFVDLSQSNLGEMISPKSEYGSNFHDCQGFFGDLSSLVSCTSYICMDVIFFILGKFSSVVLVKGLIYATDLGFLFFFFAYILNLVF